MELKDLIRACQKGDKKSRERLYRTYYRKMYGVCLFYAGSEAEALDLLQDGFYHLFRNIGKYSFKGSFEGWMRRLFVNLILQSFRKKKPLFSIGQDGSYDDDLGYEHILEEIAAKDLLKIIHELSPQYRMVFNLFAIEGYTHKEIAEQLGISEGTSKSNLSRARSILQEKVKQRYPGCYKMKSNGG